MFRRKYRELDVLAVDDNHFFDNKRATLVEFQNTLDHLLRLGKQVIVAAARPPVELSFLGTELIHRLSGGLVCRLHYPCDSSRSAILERLCEQRSIVVPGRILRRIAERLEGDVRQLIGAVNRLHAAQLAQMPLDDWSTLQGLLHDLFQSTQRAVSIDSIEQAVCEVCGVGASELRSPKRSKRVNAARNLAMWLSRKYTGNAFSEIGSHYGGRSHSTVISAQQKVSQWIQSGQSIPLASSICPAADAIDRIESKLRIG
jgi:chromosomal replication initiator protein